MKPKRIEILGIPVDCVNMQEAVQYVDESVKLNEKGTVLAVNPEKVITAQKNPELANCLKASRLLIADGIGIVFAARLLGLAEIERVPGADLMPKLCELAEMRGYSIFLFGGQPGANEGCAKELKRRFPRLKIAGRQDGYVKKEDMSKLVDNINQSGADILFVALGSPRQELWMAEWLEKLNIKICQGVGGTFDAISGNFSRAPQLAMKLHLEWLYQMIMQPRRFKRLPARLKFAYYVLISKWSN